MREQILCYAIRYDGDWKKIKQALHCHEAWEEVFCAYSYLTIVDEQYPDTLRRLECPPWILFYMGNIALLKEPGCAVVGSRHATTYGIQVCEHICNILKERYVIVSGLAKGIDGVAHQSAMDKATIGVIGCGIDTIYPKEHAALYKRLKHQHLIISEYPPGSKPYAFHFPWRNRIIAALGKALLVIEAQTHSGTMLTVNEALQLDIPIYCVPHMYQSIHGSGCNQLISQGALIVCDDEDIMMI